MFCNGCQALDQDDEMLRVRTATIQLRRYSVVVQVLGSCSGRLGFVEFVRAFALGFPCWSTSFVCKR